MLDFSSFTQIFLHPRNKFMIQNSSDILYQFMVFECCTEVRFWKWFNIHHIIMTLFTLLLNFYHRQNEFSLKFFIAFLHLFSGGCSCRDAHVPWTAWWAGSLSLPCESQGSIPGHGVWQQKPLPANPLISQALIGWISIVFYWILKKK